MSSITHALRTAYRPHPRPTAYYGRAAPDTDRLPRTEKSKADRPITGAKSRLPSEYRFLRISALDRPPGVLVELRTTSNSGLSQRRRVQLLLKL